MMKNEIGILEKIINTDFSVDYIHRRLYELYGKKKRYFYHTHHIGDLIEVTKEDYHKIIERNEGDYHKIISYMSNKIPKKKRIINILQD